MLATKQPGMTLRAIGTVRNEVTQPRHRDWEEVISEIVIDRRLTQALDGLDGFSHIKVLFWMHRAVAGEAPLKIHPRGKAELPLVGLLATRSPRRPNPIGETTVRLLERRGNILRVEGLDAINGTPVIDIKPYIPGNDSVASARVPSWVIRARGVGQRLQEVYRRLMEGYGPQHWWPAEEPFEVMVGAILTQSAAWGNVEKAIASLKEAGVLSPAALRRLPLAELAGLIRPCGYYNAKALKLKALANWLEEYCADDLSQLFEGDAAALREQLLSIHGIGDETADSILLYAAGKPVFVIDAYTRRILGRLGLAPEGKGYAAYQDLFMDNLPVKAELFNEYHALLVCLAKHVCRRRPRCHECCLADICPSRVVE
jgi:endonuclease-3 related protein